MGVDAKQLRISDLGIFSREKNVKQFSGFFFLLSGPQSHTFELIILIKTEQSQSDLYRFYLGPRLLVSTLSPGIHPC